MCSMLFFLLKIIQQDAIRAAEQRERADAALRADPSIDALFLVAQRILFFSQPKAKLSLYIGRC